MSAVAAASIDPTNTAAMSATATARPPGARSTEIHPSSSSANGRSLTRTSRSYPLNQPTTTTTTRARTGHHSNAPTTTTAGGATAGGTGSGTSLTVTPSNHSNPTHPLGGLPVVGWLVGGLVQWWSGPPAETEVASSSSNNNNNSSNSNPTTTTPIAASVAHHQPSSNVPATKVSVWRGGERGVVG